MWGVYWVFFCRVLECLLRYILSWVWDILMVAYWVWEEYLVLCWVLEWLWHLLWGFCCCKDINSVWNLQYVLGLRLVLCVLLGYILFCADAWCPTYNMNTWYYVLCCYVLCWFLGHTACILCFMLGYIVCFLACADLSLHGVPGVGDESVCGVSSDILSVLGLEGVLQLTLDVLSYLTVT